MTKASDSAISPLPKRLKEARKNKGLSQKSLGIAVGMDEFSASPRMNHYERGRHSPDFITVKQLAKKLDVPTAYFYAEEDWLAESIISLFHKNRGDSKQT
jgi:transcriptional regulator with XRE-family HTH domain